MIDRKKNGSPDVKETMRGNSLGFGNEITAVARAPASSQYCVDVEASPASSSSRLALPRMSRTVCLCCTFTTLLVASAVGVGIWFVVTDAA